jgi:hypothetical protein
VEYERIEIRVNVGTKKSKGLKALERVLFPVACSIRVLKYSNISAFQNEIFFNFAPLHPPSVGKIKESSQMVKSGQSGRNFKNRYKNRSKLKVLW